MPPPAEVPAEQIDAAVPPQREKLSYWERRKNSVYIHAAQAVCRRFGNSPRSVLDVGSNGTPTLEWHRQSAERLLSLDMNKPYRAEGVESVRTDFLKFESDTKFDLVTCFQVLEHVPNPKAFAQKLLSMGDVVVASVPYKWPEGRCALHLHDPVDRKKMHAWFDREPNYSYVSKEIERNSLERLIHVYLMNQPPPKKRRGKKSSSASGPRAPLYRRLLRRLRRELRQRLG